jgi:hypothetical protein
MTSLNRTLSSVITPEGEWSCFIRATMSKSILVWTCAVLSLSLCCAWSPSVLTSKIGLRRSTQVSSRPMTPSFRQCALGKRKVQMLISSSNKVVETIDPSTLVNLMQV